jgi:polyhydroxyalkanoate synthesis regulator phasin
MIEDVQKVNKLAQELLNQGIASSRDEAVQKAQQFLNREIAKEKTSTQTTSQTMQETSLESLRNMLERQRDMTQRQLQDFRSAINALAEEISNIKEQMSRAKVEARTASDAGLEPEQKTGQLKLKPKEAKKKEPHPKRGDWKSEDVAIEKIFYYGKK